MDRFGRPTRAEVHLTLDTLDAIYMDGTVMEAKFLNAVQSEDATRLAGIYELPSGNLRAIFVDYNPDDGVVFPQIHTEIMPGQDVTGRVNLRKLQRDCRRWCGRVIESERMI